MKKEREIIAKNNIKKYFTFILIAFLVSLPTGFNFLKDPDFRWIGIFFISGIIFIILLSLIMLIIYPNHAIVKEKENLIVWQGMFKYAFPIKSILAVEIVPLKNGEVMSNHGNITIKVQNLNEQEKIFTVNVKNKCEIIEKLNLLINQ